MRGCIVKAKTTKLRLPKGHHTWNLILSLGRGANGKHKQKWVRFHGTRQQAHERLTELAGEVHHGTFIEPSRVTVGMWLDDWHKTMVLPSRAFNTAKGYEVVIRKHLKPALGHIPLQKLTPTHVRQYGIDKKLSPRSLQLHHAVLTTALNRAVENQLVRQNVAKLVRTTASSVRTNDDALKNVWTADEARRFLAALKAGGDTQVTAFFALALDTGMRKAELLGLPWSAIADSKVRVDRQLLEMRADEKTGRPEPFFGPPKRGGVRTIDISEETLVLLREHKRQQSELKLRHRPSYVDRGLVFAEAREFRTIGRTSLGDPIDNWTIRRKLDSACATAGVKRINVHGLRHTSATLMLSAGVLPNVVQKRLGHSKIEMTLNIYAHVLPNMQTDAANRLAAMLHG